MSSNVVQLFGDRRKPDTTPSIGPADMRSLAAPIVEWADSRGIDVSDPRFEIRVSDLMACLQVLALEQRMTA